MTLPTRAGSAGPLPVVGNAAAETPGTGTDTHDGGDWLAEITHAPEPVPADGVPLTPRTKGDRHRGRALGSKRGSHRGG